MGQSPTGDHVWPKPDGLPLLNGPTEFGPVYPVPVQWTDDPRKRSQSGDLLFCVRGSTTGRMNWADQEYAIGRGLAAIRGKSGFRNSFIRANIEYRLPSLLALSSGSTFPNVSRADIESIEVAEISVDDALQASLLIESIDDKIANNRSLAADLEAMARAIFKSWFVDFDPVKAKMEGRTPVGVEADTAALFPDELVESELGLIPRSWEASTLAVVADLNPESWSARNHPDSLLYADLSGTDRGQIVDLKEYEWGEAPSRARRILRPGDTIVGTVRPGNRAYAYVGSNGLTGSTGFAVLRPRSPFYNSFIYLASTSDDAIDRLTSLADGAAYPAVRPDVVAATLIVNPPDAVIEEFAKLTQPLLDWFVAAHAENIELSQLRDTLLPRLISGKLRLPTTSIDAEPTPSEGQADV